MFDERALNEVAARNHGLLTRDWLEAAGVSDEAITRRTRRGLWIAVHPGVYRLAGAPVTWEQRLHAACLAAGPGAAVSHRAALTWWGLDGAMPGIVEIAVPRPQWPRIDGVRQVHRATDLHEHHVVVRDGIRVTTPVRTLVDLGAVRPQWAVASAYAHALGKKLVTHSAMQHALDDLGRRGRRGVGVMRRVLAERGEGRAARHLLAARGELLLQQQGLGGVNEYEIWVGKRFVAQVDRAWPELRFCVEWDGDERHLGSTAEDVERQNGIQEAGWDLRRFGFAHVTRRPEYVVTTIRRALAERAALFLAPLARRTAGHP